MKQRIITICLALPLLIAASAQAQVVIGSSTPSEPAALLQLKEYDSPSGSGGETAKSGGLLLPRVELKDLGNPTVIPADAGADKKKELTGLLVYNVNTSSGMEEGIHEWDGTRWYLLEPISNTSGFSTRKKLLRGEMTATNVPTLRMGIFEFRICHDPDPLKRKPQFRVAGALPAKTAFWFQVTRFWDYNVMGIPNMQVPQVGYTFDVGKRDIAPSDAQWYDFHSEDLKKEDQRYELWIADPLNDRLYGIDILIFQTELEPAFAILVAEY
jgi:hypothetical protein